MTEQGYTLGKTAIRQVGEVVRRVLAEYRNSEGQRGRSPVNQKPRLVQLVGALSAATDPWTDPLPSATADVISPSASGRGVIDQTLTVKNIGDLSYGAGTIGLAIWVCGYWQFTPLECGTSSPGASVS